MEMAKRPIDSHRRKSIITGVTVLTVLILLLYGASWGRPTILPLANRVDAYKVEPGYVYRYDHRIPSSNVDWAPRGALVIDNCLVVDGPKHLGAGFAQRLNATLLNPLAFTRDMSKCRMAPGFIFRIWQGGRSQDVILCFHCGQIETITRDAQGHQTAESYGRIGGGFVSLVRETFPNDPFFAKRRP